MMLLYCKTVLVISILSLLSAAEPRRSDVQSKATYPSSVSIDILPALSECPKSFTLTGKVCSRTKSTDPQRKCKHPFKLSGGKCVAVQDVDAVVSCPAASRLFDGACIIEEERSPELLCKYGYILIDGHKCVKDIETRSVVSCPKGFKKEFGQSFCTKQTKMDPEEVCPGNYWPDRQSCVAVEEVDFISVCDHGYELQYGSAGDDICVKSEEREAELSCPKGFKKSHGDRYRSGGEEKCENISKVQARLTCDIGQKLEGKKCVSISAEPPVPTCRHGFSFVDGVCSKILTEHPTLKCAENGYVLKDNVCVKRHESKANEICPDGAEADLYGKCEVREIALPQMECPHKFQLINDNVCMYTDEKPVEKKCPKSYKAVGHGCQKELRKTTEAVCKSGWELVGKNCLKTESVPVEVKCKDKEGTQMSDSQKGEFFKCISSETDEPKKRCPKGFKLENGKFGNCVRRTAVDASFICPKGTRNEKHGRCERTVIVRPELDCFGGDYEFDGRRCIKYDTTEPLLTCGDGEKLIEKFCVPKKPADSLFGNAEEAAGKKIRGIHFKENQKLDSLKKLF